jgi:uncharacterized protein (TIGR03067 family)
MRRVAVLAVAVGFLVGAEDPRNAGSKKDLEGSEATRTDRPTPAAIQAEQKRFEGTWSYASVVADGKPAAEESLKASRLVLAGDRFTVTEPETTHKGTYSVDPSVTPRSIDVTFREGPRAGKTIKGIYDLNGNTCKVCIALDDQPRPTEFRSTPGRGYALEVLKRVNP